MRRLPIHYRGTSSTRRLATPGGATPAHISDLRPFADDFPENGRCYAGPRRAQARAANLGIFTTPARLLQWEAAHAAKELNA
jgi:hypothetical protein